MSLLNDMPLTQNNPQPVSAAGSSSEGAITTTTDRELLAGQGGSLRAYIYGPQLVNASATATEVVAKDGASAIWCHYLPASFQSFDVEFAQPLRSLVNTALNFACISAGAGFCVKAQGYAA